MPNIDSKISFMSSNYLLIFYYISAIVLALSAKYFLLPFLFILALTSYFIAKKQNQKFAQAHFYFLARYTASFLLFFGFIQAFYVYYLRYVEDISLLNLLFTYNILGVIINDFLYGPSLEYPHIFILHFLNFGYLLFYLSLLVFGLYKLSREKVPMEKNVKKKLL